MDPWEASITGLCPSCRAAGRWGAVAAFLAVAVMKLALFLVS